MYPTIKTASEITPMDMIFAKVFAEAAAKTKKEHGTEGICIGRRLYEPGIHTEEFKGRYSEVSDRINTFFREMRKDYDRFEIIAQTSVPTYMGECTRITFMCE